MTPRTAGIVSKLLTRIAAILHTIRMSGTGRMRNVMYSILRCLGMARKDFIRLTCHIHQVPS